MAAVVVGGIQDGCRVTWVEPRGPLWWLGGFKMAAKSRGLIQDGRCGGRGDLRWLPSHVGRAKMASESCGLNPRWPPGRYGPIQDGDHDPSWPLYHVTQSKMAAASRDLVQDGFRVTWVDPRWPLYHVTQSKMAAASRDLVQDGFRVTWVDPRWPP